MYNIQKYIKYLNTRNSIEKSAVYLTNLFLIVKEDLKKNRKNILRKEPLYQTD